MTPASDSTPVICITERGYVTNRDPSSIAKPGLALPAPICARSPRPVGVAAPADREPLLERNSFHQACRKCFVQDRARLCPLQFENRNLPRRHGIRENPGTEFLDLRVYHVSLVARQLTSDYVVGLCADLGVDIWVSA